MPPTIFRLFLTIALLTGLFGTSALSAERPEKQEFKNLSPADKTRLDQQRATIAAAAKKRYGTAALTRTKKDLSILQRFLDDRVYSKAQTYELQSLGVVFGDVLASELPLHWIMVTDEYGTDPVLRYEKSSIQVGALTMISKRVEKGEEIDLTDLFDAAVKNVKDIAKSDGAK